MAAPKKFLFKERRRAARISGKVPAMLVLRQGRHGEVTTASSSAEILDVSLYGACLSVDQIRIDSAHLFYTPQDNPSYVLHLEVEPPPEAEEGLPFLSIPVRPIRFDRVLEEDNKPKPFHIGVEFLLDADDEQVRLLVRLIDEKSKGKGWWQSVVNTFRSVATEE